MRASTSRSRSAAAVAGFTALVLALVVAAALTAVAVTRSSDGGGSAGAASGSSSTAPSTIAAAPSTSASTSTTAPATTSTTAAPTTTTTVDDGTLRPGASGDEVVALQQRLDALGYWTGVPDGAYGGATQQAVMAFQKARGLGRDGLAGPATLAALETATREQPRSTADGVEIDLQRQILLVVTGGQVKWVINTSTGKEGWRTPPGDFVVQRAIDGVRHAPLGDLYRPRYFNGGIAVHGSPSIPGYPASHGCTRVSNGAMDALWASGALGIGTPVRVY